MKNVSIQSIQDRCIHEGDCWIWTGGKNGKGQPKVWNQTGRRVVWHLCHDVPLSPKQLVTVNCGQIDCLNPEHLCLTTKAKAAKASLTTNANMRRAAANARATRGVVSVLSIEIAREIRMSAEPVKTLAEKHGVNKSRIYKILRNEAWREFGVTSSPFAGLGAR